MLTGLQYIPPQHSAYISYRCGLPTDTNMYHCLTYPLPHLPTGGCAGRQCGAVRGVCQGAVRGVCRSQPAHLRRPTGRGGGRHGGGGRGLNAEISVESVGINHRMFGAWPWRCQSAFTRRQSLQTDWHVIRRCNQTGRLAVGQAHISTRTDRLPLRPACGSAQQASAAAGKLLSRVRRLYVTVSGGKREHEPSGPFRSPFHHPGRKPADYPLWRKEPCVTAITADNRQACDWSAGCLISWP